MFETLFKKPLSGKNSAFTQHPLTVDVHAHILPHLDDGAANVEQSIAIIKGLQTLGYKKIIATPHVMSGFYNNSYEEILQSLQLLKGILKRYNIPVELEASAEYYLEDNLFRSIERGEVLTFGNQKKYLLFEASFITKPSYLIESARRIQQAGYIPVLAHPERYISLNNMDTLTRLLFNGILFQVNIGSLTGYYSKQAQETAEILVKKNMVAFFGTNCHNESQLKSIKSAFELPYFQYAAKENVLNNTLIQAQAQYWSAKIYSRI
ncbi:tyrosine-protein phosphatase [Emticicia sp. BO119]|uniref:tyrosine-protein phosphatase n=1 Tax=Emticicia sp. BO119 TaxID=2757768 RepID=UPI0015F05D48|nr:CpsB/CapC family capsule biosynthesis tyrosine phosphatase [Emticicia sp. BO119]MBA4849162.1 capsular biosynthesis protein [Emticicia sp. BO119]